MRRMIPSKLIDWIKSLKDKFIHNSETNTLEVGGNLEVDGTLKASGGEEVITDVQAVIDEGNPQLNLKQGNTIVNITDMNPILANGEKMEGYKYEDVSKQEYINPSFISACKNGNKLTLVACGKIILTDVTQRFTSYSNLWTFNFIIPASVGAKIIPLTSSRLDQKSIKLFSNTFLDVFELNITFSKTDDTHLNMSVFGTDTAGSNLTIEREYAFRIEETFLLNDNLISE